MQRLARPLVFAASVFAAGCSLVIDVPADCANGDCGAYVCASDRIACLDSCTGDAECASGYVCDVSAGRCEPTGCQPVFESVVLGGLPASINEFAAAAGGNPEQLMVVVGRGEGLGFRRYNINGAVVQDPPDEALGLVRLAAANENRLPFLPAVRFLSAADATADGDAARFVMGWRSATASRDQFGIGTFVVDPPQAPSSRVLFEERARTEISDLDFRPNGLGLLAVWRAKSGQTGEVWAVQTDLFGNVGTATPALLTPEERVADVPALARLGDVFFAPHTIAGDGVRSLSVTALDGAGTRIGTLSLRSDQSATGFRVADTVGLSAGNAAGVLWTEPDGSNEAAYLAVFDDAVVQALRPTEVLAVPPIRLASNFASVGRVRGADAHGGFLVGWRGVLEGRDSIWVQRLAADGTPRFSPIPVAGSGVGTIADYEIIATSTGVGVVWLLQGDGGNPDQLLYRRFECTDVR